MLLLEFKGFIKMDELSIKFFLDQLMFLLFCLLIYYDIGKFSDILEKLLYLDYFLIEMFYFCFIYFNLFEVFVVFNYKLIGLCKFFNILYIYI